MNEKIKIRGTGFAVLTNIKTGEKRIIPLKNIVTNDGDRYYATKGAGESAYFTVGGMRLGTGVDAPVKADTDVETFLAGSGKVIYATYPKTNDTDPDNTGAAVDSVSWCVSYAAGEATGDNISELAIVDNIVTPTKALNHALFAAPFNKTAADTLKVFVNHNLLGT